MLPIFSSSIDTSRLTQRRIECRSSSKSTLEFWIKLAWEGVKHFWSNLSLHCDNRWRCCNAHWQKGEWSLGDCALCRRERSADWWLSFVCNILQLLLSQVFIKCIWTCGMFVKSHEHDHRNSFQSKVYPHCTGHCSCCARHYLWEDGESPI